MQGEYLPCGTLIKANSWNLWNLGNPRFDESSGTYSVDAINWNVRRVHRRVSAVIIGTFKLHPNDRPAILAVERSDMRTYFILTFDGSVWCMKETNMTIVAE